MPRLFADTTPLRNSDFRRLWTSGIVTVIGANLTIFAVPVQIYALTQNSGYVGLSGLFALVPLIMFGLLGGAWADAVNAPARSAAIPRMLPGDQLAAANSLNMTVMQSARSSGRCWLVCCSTGSTCPRSI